MNVLGQLPPYSVDGIEILVLDAGVKLIGVLSMRSPSETVTPFFKRVHNAAVINGLKAVSVDMTQLRFMNSSSIRSLIDWVEWIRGEPEDKRYVLTFITKPDVTWQETTLAAIRSFGGDQVAVSRA